MKKNILSLLFLVPYILWAQNSSDNIVFADPYVKSICVSNWDSNGDGELSMNEAAAVTDLGKVFYKIIFTSFDELQYFTGLTSIRRCAFWGCSGLTSITIPESVTSIGEDAFGKCSSLTSITIPESVISIDNSVFDGCTSLPVENNVRYAGPYLVGATDKTLPTYTIREGTRYIGKSAFEDCSSLTNITIPESVTLINACAFYECSSLTSIIIPEGVTKIDHSAFYGCSSLTSIIIPEGVTKIDYSAFYGCSSLTNITIPESVTEIGGSAFYGCSSLTNITIPEGVTSIDSNTFEGCTSLTNITIPEGVTSIGDEAFSGCSGLTSITIPDGVTSIGPSAFYGCTGLTSITIPDGVTRIMGSAFSNCTGLTSITIPESVTEIGGSAFYGCSSLTNITIPEDVTSIGAGAFSGCSSLTNITIPEGVKYIYENTFFGCSSLTSITIPESVKEIREPAFFGCTSLPVENNIRYADSYLVEAIDKTLSTYTIRESTRFIGSSAFKDCSSLISITIPEGVTSIGSSAFYGCSSLTSITIPEGVEEINYYTFENCSSLTNIILPGTVRQVGRAFIGCDALKMMKIDRDTPPGVLTRDYNYFGFLRSVILVVPRSAVKNYLRSRPWYGAAYIVSHENDLLNSFEISDLAVEHGAEINLPVSMTNQEQITAAEFDLQVPNGVKLLSCSMTERKNGHEINFVQNGNNYYHVTIFSLTSSAIDGNEGELLNLKLLAESEGNFNLSIINIELSTKEGERRNPPYRTSATVTINDIPLGDVNGDGEVTITDAVSIVNHRLDRTPVRFISAAADLNADNEITITDAVRIVNMILSDHSSAKFRIEPAISLPEPQ